jgi:2-amino-4-hydroxy-6-hydroxymethyldihydropteridine diphosphokinase
MVSEAVISLGGNLGNREQTISEAITEISKLKNVELISQSALYETVALTLAGEDENAPKFLNCVVKIRTKLEPKKLLKKLFEIENKHGRVRLERWGPRTLDIDIIAFGSEILQTKSLQIPHPRAHQRGFVLIPWAEIDSEAVLPGHGSVAKLAERFRSSVQEV